MRRHTSTLLRIFTLLTFCAAILLTPQIAHTQSPNSFTMAEEQDIGTTGFMKSAPVASEYVYCSIVLGGGGESETYGTYLAKKKGEVSLTIPYVRAREFIRSTSGPCYFVLWNHSDEKGRHVVLGTDLSRKIRAGEDGVENRTHGGGETWRVRSLSIVMNLSWPGKPDCTLRIGGNGVRMTYFSSHQSVPAMNRISRFSGEGCKASLHSSPLQSYNRGKRKTIDTFPDDGTAYDPGFRVRSFSFYDD